MPDLVSVGKYTINLARVTYILAEPNGQYAINIAGAEPLVLSGDEGAKVKEFLLEDSRYVRTLNYADVSCTVL